MGRSYRVKADVQKKVAKKIVAFLKEKNAESIWGQFGELTEAPLNELSVTFPDVVFSEEVVDNGRYQRSYRLNGIWLLEETVYPDAKVPTEKQFHRAHQDLLESQAAERKAAEARKVQEEEERQKRIEELKAELGQLETEAA